MVPSYSQFQYEHSRAGSALIAQYDAYIILSAEYNHGVPGALKTQPTTSTANRAAGRC